MENLIVLQFLGSLDNYVEISFQNISSATNDILIAKLTEIGFEGFEEEEFNLRAFISADDFDKTLFDKIIQSNSLSLPNQ